MTPRHFTLHHRTNLQWQTFIQCMLFNQDKWGRRKKSTWQFVFPWRQECNYLWDRLSCGTPQTLRTGSLSDPLLFWHLNIVTRCTIVWNVLYTPLLRLTVESPYCAPSLSWADLEFHLWEGKAIFILQRALAWENRLTLEFVSHSHLQEVRTRLKTTFRWCCHGVFPNQCQVMSYLLLSSIHWVCC